MKRKIEGWIPAALLLAAACQSNDLGSGANTVDREFSKPAVEVWKASVKSAEEMELKGSHDTHDQFGGEFTAERAGGQEVHIWVRSLDERHSQVSVRVAPGDRALAVMLQERIADTLGLGQARRSFLGGNAAEGTYSQDIGLAMLAARRVFHTLQVTITEHEAHAQWARIDGRIQDSVPVQIRIDQLEDQKMKVTFIAGNDQSQDNSAFARRMKEAYDAASQNPSPAH